MRIKRWLCLVLALCALLALSGCQEKKQYPVSNSAASVTEAVKSESEGQNLYGETEKAEDAEVDFDDGSYDPASEETGEWEDVEEPGSGEAANGTAEVTVAPMIQSEYAGATPLLIDPVDKPTATPLPTLTMTYATYEAAALHLSFEGPAGWVKDESATDTFKLTNPDPSMDYAASLTVRMIPVNKQYSKSELIREVKGMLDTLNSSGEYSRFEPSNTAERTFLGATGVYANYKAVLQDGTLVAGRMIVTCIDKTLYTLHVAYPRGYTDFYVENVYNKFRHSVKKI